MRKAIMSLPSEQVTADLNACVDYCAKLPACNGKVAVAGFCWGGNQSFRFATNNKTIKAAFSFYGTGPDKEADIERIACPVYGFYGENDARVSATIETTEKLMKKAGKTYEPVIYKGAGHGFMCAGEEPDANKENKTAREDAWRLERTAEETVDHRGCVLVHSRRADRAGQWPEADRTGLGPTVITWCKTMSCGMKAMGLEPMTYGLKVSSRG